MTPFAPPAVALCVALQSAPVRPRVTWCLCRVHPVTNAPIVVETREAESRTEALALLPPHPEHWFVTSRASLTTLGTIPVDFAQPPRRGPRRRSA